MAEEIKELIEKIQQEGIQAAEDKAKEIEDEAYQRANEIVDKAKLEARKLRESAEQHAKKTEVNTKELLRQSGRDLMLSLKKEVNKMLENIISAKVHQALTPEELSKAISSLVKGCSKEKAEVIVTLNKHDLEKLEHGFLSELKDELKKGLTLKPSEDIRAGFVISFDAGKSQFEFTDKALSEYIGSYLKPKLAEFLKSE